MANLEVGTELGLFKLRSLLGKGGAAEAWRATEMLQDGSSREVAVKILRPEHFASPEFRAMFHDEVHIASQLDHENVVRVHGAYELEGYLIQALEFVDGKDLRSLLSSLVQYEETLPVPFALMVAKEAADALCHIHTKCGRDGKLLGIVHRDVSPHNIMLNTQGSLKVLDFGVAFAKNRLVRTQEGIIKGKLSYMSPEQVTGGDVSPRSDIFSLGVVLWEMLMLKKLFTATDDVETVRRIMAGNIPPIRQLRPDVPQDVEELVDDMLNQDPDQRPSSMDIVARALSAILSHEYPSGATEKAALAAWLEPYLLPIPPTVSVRAIREVHDTDPIVLPTTGPTEKMMGSDPHFHKGREECPTVALTVGPDPIPTVEVVVPKGANQSPVGSSKGGDTFESRLPAGPSIFAESRSKMAYPLLWLAVCVSFLFLVIGILLSFSRGC